MFEYHKKYIYINIKSCLQVNGSKLPSFTSNTGVRQGENLSPFLFNIYLNDLYDFFRSKNINGVYCTSHASHDDIWVFAEFLFSYTRMILLYSVNQPRIYRLAFKHIKNIAIYGNKKLILQKLKSYFSKDNNSNYEFKIKYKDEILEIVSEFKYLGVLFSKNNSFFKTKQHTFIANQGKKAVYSLFKKARNMQRPIDLQLELFNKLVKPVLLYGCEIWGLGNIDVIERVQLMFIKRILNLKNNTPNYMVLGELGMMPLKIDIFARIFLYWGKINKPESHINNLRQDVDNATHSYYKYSNINNKSFISNGYIA